jgi:hypothetical protein
MARRHADRAARRVQHCKADRGHGQSARPGSLDRVDRTDGQGGGGDRLAPGSRPVGAAEAPRARRRGAAEATLPRHLRATSAPGRRHRCAGRATQRQRRRAASWTRGAVPGPKASAGGSYKVKERAARQGPCCSSAAGEILFCKALRSNMLPPRGGKGSRATTQPCRPPRHPPAGGPAPSAGEGRRTLRFRRAVPTMVSGGELSLTQANTVAANVMSGGASTQN